MAHYAEIDSNNIVTRVLVVPNDQEDRGHEFLSVDLGLGGRWYKTSYNTVAGEHTAGGTPFRKNYAGVGYTFNESLNAFIPPKLYPSWILDENKCIWKAPVEIPGGSAGQYSWNEEELSWEIIE